MTRRFLIVVAALAIAAGTLHAQRRRLGPADRTNIIDSRVDQAYTSTTLKQLLLLPFGNELDYPEGAEVLAENFVSEMKQKFPDLVVRPPLESVQLITSLGLAEQFRLFRGTYLNTGVVSSAFLQALGKGGKVDGLLLGRVLAYHATSTRNEVLTPIGTFTFDRNRAVVGMELQLLRGSDGRELWWGIHAVEGNRNENVISVSKTVAEVVARFFGRRPY